MNSLTIGLMVFTLFWMLLFEAGILFLCYHTFNMIADIRAYIARGRGKDDSKNDRKRPHQ
jgi:hypothetical protein